MFHTSSLKRIFPLYPEQMDMNGCIQWLQGIKDSHGAVEVNALAQAKAINARGIYRLGAPKKKPMDKHVLGVTDRTTQLRNLSKNALFLSGKLRTEGNVFSRLKMWCR